MIVNPLVENSLDNVWSRIEVECLATLPFCILSGFRGNEITDIDFGNKSVQSQRLVFSLFEPGLDSPGVTKNVIRDQLLEVPNLTRTYQRYVDNRLQFSVQDCQTISFLPMKHCNFIFPIFRIIFRRGMDSSFLDSNYYCCRCICDVFVSKDNWTRYFIYLFFLMR